MNGFDRCSARTRSTRRRPRSRAARTRRLSQQPPVEVAVRGKPHKEAYAERSTYVLVIVIVIAIGRSRDRTRSPSSVTFKDGIPETRLCPFSEGRDDEVRSRLRARARARYCWVIQLMGVTHIRVLLVVLGAKTALAPPLSMLYLDGVSGGNQRDGSCPVIEGNVLAKGKGESWIR